MKDINRIFGNSINSGEEVDFISLKKSLQNWELTFIAGRLKSKPLPQPVEQYS